MNRTRIGRTLLFALAAAALGSTARAQVQVVNIVPQSRSGETRQDSEPNLAVNPANPLQIAASAFTPDPLGGPNAPIYVSTNGGTTWALNSILPGNSALTGTGDVTLRFGGTSNVLYAGTLRGGAGLTMNILRTTNFTLPNVMTLLVSRTNVDQPYIQATTTLGGGGVGQDRVYVGNNDFVVPSPGRRTATIDRSLNGVGATPPPPSNFGLFRIEARSTGQANQDGPPIRPALHPDGTIYAIFNGWRTFVGGLATTDVVVVRDDNWGAGPNAFQALADPGDGLPGRRVVQNVQVPFNNQSQPNFGQERFVASNISIAVDPRNSSIVYIAWADFPGGVAPYTLHVRRSNNRGATWTGDLLTVQNATNPALAVNIHGKVGFLYQQVTGTGAAQRWETHLRRSVNSGASWDDLVLARPPATTPAPQFIPYIGDYVHLMAVGKNFHGIFSASNTPNLANFPQGVTYQRNANFTTGTLFAVDGVTPVAISIDPFYFRVTEVEPRQDFYVRDWTASPASGDTGVEPSTDPVFYARSDVWNRRGTLPGPFPNDQPSNEPAGNGIGPFGDNWAFTRIRRNATGVAQTVRAHFLVSRFGTGSNYQDANPNALDPTVSFTAGELGPKVTPAFFWHLDPINSSHLCLAVEISTPNDPFVPPSLRGFAPGWPTTDLKVILDNNKAQRNMGLSRTRARGVGGAPSGQPGFVSFYGIVHNAATFPRDVTLQYFTEDPEKIRERFPDARIEIVGERAFPLDAGGGTLTLAAMQPGENRWVGLSFPEPEQSEEEVLAVFFEELAGDQVVNGFALGAQVSPLDQLIQEILQRHYSAHVRLAEGFGVAEAGESAEVAAALLASEDFSDGTYADFVADQLPTMEASLLGLKDRLAGDRFGTQGELKLLKDLYEQGGGAPTPLYPVHSSYLNKLDSFLTALQLAHGDTADILQNVRWQQDLSTRVPELAALSPAATLTELSREFVQGYRDRALDDKHYPELLDSLLPAFHETAGLLAGRLPDLKDHVTEIETALQSANLAAMQKAHRGYLLSLQSLEVPSSSSGSQ